MTKKRLLIAGGIVLAFLILTPIITYLYFAHDIADRERLMNRNDTGLVLLDRHGKVFYEYGTVNLNDNVPLSKISDHVEHAVVASEDDEFYNHPGFSIRGIAGALWADIRNADATAYGGSTITQQLVKNRLLSSDKSFFRKYQEIAMAVAIEQRYSKDEILDMYLNSVYFGEGAFGISEAARIYFGKKPADLSLAESSMLIGLLPAPSAYSPISGEPGEARQQQERVLRRMVETSYISNEQKQQAIDQELDYAGGSPARQQYGQHFARMIIDELEDTYGEERITRSGFEVTTTLDLKWQKQAEAMVKQQVQQTKEVGGRNASLVAQDPKTGQVLALVGSVDWSNDEFGQVNMATTPRQPGSSFKPIYYSEAFDEKLITAATILDDSKKTFGNSYSPTNFDSRYKGKMTVRSALAESRNVPAVEVMQKLSVSNAVKAAQEMGLSTIDDPSRYGLSLALGTAEVRLVDMVNAYSAFAHQGLMPEQTLIDSIKDKFGKTVFEHEPADPKPVRSPGAAFIMADILSDPAAREPTYHGSMDVPGYDVALKTGTTNDSRDGWTIGFTPNLVIGAWMGNNEHEPMIGLGGSSSAGVIWKQAMTEFLPDMPKDSFKPATNITQLLVCRGTESRAIHASDNTFLEYFIKGTEPNTTCNTQPINQKPEPKPPEDDKPPKKDDKPDQNNGGGNGNGDGDGTGDSGGGNDTEGSDGSNDGSGTDDGGGTGDSDSGSGGGDTSGGGSEPTDPTSPSIP